MKILSLDRDVSFWSFLSQIFMLSVDQIPVSNENTFRPKLVIADVEIAKML